METVRKVVLQVVLPVTAVLCAEVFYRESLFEASLQDIPMMQAKTKL